MNVLELDTPAVAIDRRVMEANLRRAQDYADANGIRLRPHIKTHKIPEFARLQLELGAIGITCQKLGEVEVMADAGIEDIFLPYNILGREKLDRLAALHDRITLSVSADSEATIEGYSARFADSGHRLPVLIECDTGGGRCGVASPERMLELARLVSRAPGLTFKGIMTYPPRGKVAEVQAWLEEATALATRAGLSVECVSNGGSPDFYRLGSMRAATEHRPGTYIYSDRMQVSFGHGTLADCALSVVATVVSRPTGTRAVLDAGSKALAADTCAAPGHGHIVEYPDSVITALSEEHAMVDLSISARRPVIGERVRVIPNHACVVSNLFDKVHVIEDGQVAGQLEVAARGRLA